MGTAIVWFRQDLRLMDNPALQFAIQSHDQVIPLYIFDNNSKNPWPIGGAQRWWLHHSLEKLHVSLNKTNSFLVLRKGECLKILTNLIKEINYQTIYWNRCYEPYAIARDKHIKTMLEAEGIVVKVSNGNLLNEPWEVMNQQNKPFKVYTPYWRQAQKKIEHPSILPVPKNLNSAASIPSERLSGWKLLPTTPNWAQGFSIWNPGEKGAHQALQRFLDHHLLGYVENRDRPDRDITSHLSPHLHWGELSARQIYTEVQRVALQERLPFHSIEKFLAQLGWREFSYYLLYHFPHIAEKNFKSEFDSFDWNQDEKMLHCWQQGKTGYPIVDAGMRELWSTGTMHNRVRMIAASFLTKDLLIDWRKGAQWFWDTLVDADLANNSAGWQWVAGSGADAAPYFRIFNPILQGEKFDPEGVYIRRWLPELSKISNNEIHRPWKIPVIDHEKAREISLKSYQKIRGLKKHD